MTVAVEDVNGQIVTGDSSSVTIAINGPGNLCSTLTEPVINGIATFNNLSTTTAGSLTLKATDGALTSAISGSFSVAPAAAVKLAFVQQPGNVGTGSPITPAVTVAVEDAYGNVVATNTSTVTMSLGSGPGTLSVQAVKGVATLSNLLLSAPGQATLAASDGTYTAAVSSSFTVATTYNFNFSSLVGFNSTNGKQPESTLIADGQGNLYGTTSIGGANSDGTVFKMSAGNHLVTTLATFNGTNGANPMAGLIMDSSGNLFGTTDVGGTSNLGTVFEVSSGSGIVTTLANFNGANGTNPQASLYMDSRGNLFGTTYAGGASNKGTVYEVSAGGTC